MSGISRRQALQAVSAAGAGFFAAGTAPAFLRARNLNEEVRMAVIGTGGRGGSHIQGFSRAENSRVVALCDADEDHVGRSAERLQKSTEGQVDIAVDYRKLLERDDIDAVSVAAPNHWHALMTIHACQAGKHVYTEKPVCHTVWEGRQMVRAMQQSGRIVAAGFQNRSDKGLLQAIPQIHEGRIGRITMARGLCYRNRASIGRRDTPLAPPAGLNYDLWLGPAADLPIMRPKFHYDWHWVFNTGNGDMGNQGPHEMDLLRWALGDPQHPASVQSIGGRFAWDDAGDTPNLQIARFDFGDGVPVLFEVRNMHQKDNNTGRYSRGPGVGIIITGEKGEFRGGRGGGAFYDNDGNEVERYKGDSGGTHMENFVECIRGGSADGLRSPIESAYYSSCMSHLANISVRVGQSATTAEVLETVQADSAVSEVAARFAEQLALYDVDTKKTPWGHGPKLTFDSVSEQFTAGERLKAANALLRREDRKPYEVPDLGA